MTDDLSQARIQYVRVTNWLAFPFTDRHDGVPVTIPPGRSENLPIDMAAHFFGPDMSNPAVMLRHIARRQGWNTPEFVKQNPDTHKTLADEYFGKLKIEPVFYKLVPAESPDPREPVPADPEVPSADAEVKRGRGRPPLAKQSGAAA